MNIGTVVEGPTDALVLMAVINHLYPGDHRYFDLQPSVRHSERGNGWKGVRAWCKETWQRKGASLAKLISADTGAPLDLLIIALDTDIAMEADLQDDGLPAPVADVQAPCPPITPTVANLVQVVRRWLKHTDVPLPPQVLLAFPAQDMETWTFAALYPDDDLCRTSDYECYHTGAARARHPGYLLTLKAYGKWLKRDGVTIKKSVAKYRDIIPQIAANWSRVCEVCTQAQRFEVALRARMR
jgi:hypothetical protein